MTTLEIIALFGIPSAITGLFVWYFKRRIEENERKAAEREENLESLVLMMMRASKANSIGIEAIARAVQRIPDAKCNGDMEAALSAMNKIQESEDKFLIEKGIKHIFE